MNIIITGGAGFIGSALVKTCLSEGHSVLVIDKLTYAGSLKNLADAADNNQFTFYKADICNQDEMDKIFNEFYPDAIMNLAAESHVDRSIASPDSFIKSNIIGTYNLLNSSLKFLNSFNKKNFRFHQVSTDEVYGSLNINSFEKFTEMTPFDPRSPYSASKASADHLVSAWNHTYKLPTVITNCSNNYGPHQHNEKLIPVIVSNALKGNSIPIYGDGKNIRDWLFVNDHVDALLKVLKMGKIGRTYNIGGNCELENLQVVKYICDYLDLVKPLENKTYHDLITFVEDRPGHDRRYAIDQSLIEKELKWKPKTNFEEGIKTTVDWYLEKF